MVATDIVGLGDVPFRGGRSKGEVDYTAERTAMIGKVDSRGSLWKIGVMSIYRPS